MEGDQKPDQAAMGCNSQLERRVRNGLVEEPPLEWRHGEPHSARVRLGERKRNCTVDSHRLHTGSRS